MNTFIEFFQHILDPNWIMSHGGLYLVLLILFIETGLFFGFFLPGDPLLFISGVVIASSNEDFHFFSENWMNLSFWMALFILATILGYFLGYWFGNKFGYRLSKKEDSLFFKKRYIDAAHDFYGQKGGLTIAISRFLPIVRTFSPIIAGMIGMDFKKFTFYNLVGGFIWVVSLTSLGYALGENKWVKENLEYVIIGLVLIVTLPVIWKVIFKKKG
jgi:membrane-associated protein